MALQILMFIFILLVLNLFYLGVTYPFYGLRPSEKTVRRIFTFIGVFSTLCMGFLLFQDVQHGEYEFFKHVKLVIDVKNIIIYLTSSVLLAITSLFSFTYIHKDISFHKFFLNLSLFWLGIYLFIFSNAGLITFAGWEFIGISSIFLISYYHYRKSPIFSSIYVVNYYKLADIILLACILFLSHSHILNNHTEYQEFLYLGIVIAGLIKSASFPFTSWLPKAMEGPTPSSAIFYSALSVNTGVLLIWKFMPQIAEHDIAKYVLLAAGVMTVLYSSILSRVQSDIKSNLVYSSSAQIGLVLIELYLGYTDFALVHLFSNSFFKCYQFMRTPSVLNIYHTMEGEYGQVFTKNGIFVQNLLPKCAREKLYFMAINHFYLDEIIRLPSLFIQMIGKVVKFVLFPLAAPKERITYKSLIWWGYYVVVTLAIGYNALVVDDSYFDIIPLLIFLLATVIYTEKNTYSFVALFFIYKILESFIIHGVHTNEPLKLIGIFVVGLFTLLLVVNNREKLGKGQKVFVQVLALFFMLFFTNFPFLLQSLVNEHIIDAFIMKDKIGDLALYAVGNTLFNIGLYNFVFNRVYLEEGHNG